MTVACPKCGHILSPVVGNVKCLKCGAWVEIYEPRAVPAGTHAGTMQNQAKISA